MLRVHEFGNVGIAQSMMKYPVLLLFNAVTFALIEANAQDGEEEDFMSVVEENCPYWQVLQMLGTPRNYMYFVCSGPSGTACTIPNLTMISWVLRTDRDVQCNDVMSGKLHVDKCSTVPVDRMSHRKWREAKQQPSRTRSGNQISCCLVSFPFLCDILSTGPVD